MLWNMGFSSRTTKMPDERVRRDVSIRRFDSFPPLRLQTETYTAPTPWLHEGERFRRAGFSAFEATCVDAGLQGSRSR